MQDSQHFYFSDHSVSDIKVTLNNEGIDAYHPEVYGDSIIVERKLSRARDNGCTSEYKIRSSKTGNSKCSLKFLIELVDVMSY